MPPASNIWTPQREVTLVDELSKRRFLQVAWLPLSPGGSPRFVEAIDDDGQRKIGRDFLSMLFVAVFGREAATDPEVIRRKLNALCKVYFRELKDLDAEASPEKHLIPWGRLPIDRYQRRRKPHL